MMEICAAVEKRFVDALGLNAAAVGRIGIERIVREGVKRSGVADAATYLELLSTSPAEFQRCIEDLVVPETWFFRDTEPFILLKQHLCEKWFPSHLEGTVRILSAPCSTGEEPYSIAITLLEAGIPPQRFCLDAADISRRALAAAGRAIYGKRAFRKPLSTGQEAFFSGQREERRVDSTVVRTVRFHHENLVDPSFLIGQAPYDIIFCRNVLIYLTDEARRRVIESIGRLLAKDGILFTGHAEMGILLQQGFTPIRHARAFACMRATEPQPSAPDRETVQTAPRKRPAPSWPPAAGAALSSVEVRTPPPSPQATPLPPSKPQTVTSEALHAEALALANRGLFNEAATLCRRYLRERRPHADGYCLLGMIHEAAGESSDAEECYLKALYLDPDHYETLIHLSLLYRQQRNDRKAALYRNRADATGRRPNGTIGP